MPELFYVWDVEFFIRGVYACHSRTDAHHVEVWVLSKEETTLKTCMDCHYSWLFAVKFIAGKAIKNAREAAINLLAFMCILLYLSVVNP